MPNAAFSCPLTHRAVLKITGDDRRPFLQGLLSNDLGRLSPEKPLFAALLTPQGKFLHDMFLFESGDEILLDCEATRAEDLIQRLTTYRLRAKVTIADATLSHTVWVSIGEDGETPDPRLSQLGSRFLRPKNSANATNDQGACDHHRLSLGVPDGNRDMLVGKSTLSDGNYDLLNGISWTKGCYVGQELTARMHHRALVKKRMFPVRIEGANPPAGSVIHSEGTEVGEMRSSNSNLGLALLSIEEAKQAINHDRPFTCEQSRLTPYMPDWLKL